LLTDGSDTHLVIVDLYNKETQVEISNVVSSPSDTFRGVSLELSTSTINDLQRVQLRYLFKDYAPVIFYRLRQLGGISNEQYLNALHAESFLGNLKNQNFSEGKSGSFFCFSPDKNFIMKTIDISEAQVLREILPSYYFHLANNPSSLLTRLYGLHSVKIQNDVEIFVLLMGNLFNTPRKIHEKYDLKGSWVKRSVKEHSENASELGKDMDLKRTINVGPEKKDQLLSQLTRDTLFLKDEGIMDYSLLVGFSFVNQTTSDTNQTNKEDIEMTKMLSLVNEGTISTDGKEFYYIGLIDILQRYNFQKKMERCVKVYFLHANKDGLSVQPVDVYNSRFLFKMGEIIV